MKHFEELWEKAESLSSAETPEAEHYQFIADHLNQMKDPIIFGEVIFHLCALSKSYDINVFAALYHVVNEKQIERLE